MDKAPHSSARIERTKRVEANDDVIETITLKPGKYFFEFGMRELDLNDTRWFHGGNDSKEMRAGHAVVLDAEHPLFEQMTVELRERADGTTLMAHPEAFAIALAEVVDAHVESAMEEPPVFKASDIVISGKGACASKALVAGILVKKVVPDATVKMVLGVVGRTGYGVSFPFLHEWLHITQGEQGPVILQDFMYKRYQVCVPVAPGAYRKTGNLDFARYTPLAFEFTALRKRLDVRGTRGIDWADHHGEEMSFVPAEFAFETQLDGTTTAALQVGASTFTTRNGMLECGPTDIADGPLLRYRLINIAGLEA